MIQEAEQVRAPGEIVSAAAEAIAAWERGENRGDYRAFRALISPEFNLYSHPLVERGVHRGEEARRRMEALIAAREIDPNNLSFSNIRIAQDEGRAVVQFDSAGTLARGRNYRGYNAIEFVFDRACRVTGFREYAGDSPEEWLK